METIKTSELLFEKLKEFEGCRLEAYQDAAGVWTIGYGHTEGVRKGDKITPSWAEKCLLEDLERVEKQVLELGVCKTQGQLDALVSFVFNVGIGNLKRSKLLKYIEGGWPRAMIMPEWKRWTYAGGKRLPGLLKRRNWEVGRFFEK